MSPPVDPEKSTQNLLSLLKHPGVDSHPNLSQMQPGDHRMGATPGGRRRLLKPRGGAISVPSLWKTVGETW